MWVRVAIAVVLLLLPSAVHAQAEKRIALLIGNKTSPLPGVFRQSAGISFHDCDTPSRFYADKTQNRADEAKPALVRVEG